MAEQSPHPNQRQAALYHANILQHRKETEFRILESLEALLDLPTSAQADPARPSTEDVHALREALTLFQPSDYDVLVEERNINRLCGYALCPRPNKLLKTSANRIIIRDNGNAWDPLKIMDRKALEHWCSDDCGKRALYLKVQLNEEPGWERATKPGGAIVLLSEDDHPGAVDPKWPVHYNEEDTISSAMRELAIERGDISGSDRSTRAAAGNIMENPTIPDSTPLPPGPSHDVTGNHDLIEGYKPHVTGGRAQRSSVKDNDDYHGSDLSGLLHSFRIS